MSATRHVVALTRAELVLELRTGDVLRTVAPYAVAALVLLALSVDANTVVLRQIGLGAGWTVLLLFGSQAASRRGLLDRAAVHELCRVSGVAPRTLLAARVVTTTTLLTVLLAVLVPVVVALFDLSLAGGLWLLSTALAALIGLATLTSIAGALVTTTAVRGVVAPLLVVPLSVPLLLSVVQVPPTLAYGGSPLPWLLVAVLVAVTLLTMAAALAPWLEGNP